MLASSFFNSSNAWFGYIANASFTFVAIAGLGKIAQRYFAKHSSKELERIEVELARTKENMDDKFEQLISQHRNNGGSSAKDQWDRLEHKVDGIGRDLNRHLGYHEGLIDSEE